MNPDLPDWPPDGATTRATMVLAEPCAVGEDPAGELRRLWEGVL